jgi:hypothetical protein
MSELSRYVIACKGIAYMMNCLFELKFQDSYKYSQTSNNGHCRGIQILSVIGGVR